MTLETRRGTRDAGRGTRVAIVHDWLTGMRGGEKVLEAILELFPAADLYTLFHIRGSVSPAIEKRPIYTSRLQRWVTKLSDYRKLLPLFPGAISEFDFSAYDLVISSSHCVAKGADGGLVHVCYCHTPMRYVWDRFDDYFPRRQPLRRAAAVPVAAWLRRWDRRTASCVHHFVANSNFVRQRIRNYYGRDAAVIHPFVDDAFLRPPIQESRDDFHVIVSALVPYKRLDLAMRAADVLGRRLVIIGDGPMRRELQRRASRGVELFGNVSIDVLIQQLSRAQSLILPGVEDFGITPLEAMACGTPVVAYGSGGALETVVEGKTGLFFHQQSSSSLADAIRRVEEMNWDRAAIRQRANQFSKARFMSEFGEFIGRVFPVKAAKAAG